MTDFELLELAAMAAGIDGEHTIAPNGTWVFYEPRKSNWNPLTDYGDALRLAVTLRLSIYHPPNGHTLVLDPKGKDAGQDPDTRRAIVRAAAEIGLTATPTKEQTPCRPQE